MSTPNECIKYGHDSDHREHCCEVVEASITVSSLGNESGSYLDGKKKGKKDTDHE